MKLSKRSIGVITFAFLLALGLMVVPLAVAEGVKKSLAILPLENLSADLTASKVVTGLLKKELKERGTVEIANEKAVEDFLAKRWIRYTGGIPRLYAREMGKVLGVDAVMVGTIDLFSKVGEDVRVGLTIRLVSTIDGSILWTDSLSYTGGDFVGLLGLGRVTSIEHLSSMVVKDLIKGIPDRFIVKETGISPFEIEEATILPPIGRGGERITIGVNTIALTEEPKEVKAIVNGKEVILEKKEDGRCEGTVIAPDEEGVYYVEITAVDHDMNPFSFHSVAKVVVDNTPPKVRLTLSSNVFSPSRRGYIIFTPSLEDLEEIDGWSIEIVDKEGKRVRGDKGYGRLPRALIWRGESDSNLKVEDGEYTYRFVVTDTADNRVSLSDKIKVKSTPPQVKVDIHVIQDKIVFTFTYDSKREERIQSWRLAILDENGKEIKVMGEKGDIPFQVEYPIEGKTDVNNMAFSFTVIDEAGNPFSLSKPLSAIILKKTPFTQKRRNGLMVEDF